MGKVETAVKSEIIRLTKKEIRGAARRYILKQVPRYYRHKR